MLRKYEVWRMPDFFLRAVKQYVNDNAASRPR